MTRFQIKACFVKVLVILVVIAFLLVEGCATVGEAGYDRTNIKKSTNEGNDDQGFIDTMFALLDPVESLLEAVEPVLAGGADTRFSEPGYYKLSWEEEHAVRSYSWSMGAPSFKSMKIDMSHINVNGLGGQ